jgi:predicted dehydrogenase
MRTIGVGIIGSGAIALANHLPGLALDKRAAVVALCDADAATLERAVAKTGVTAAHRDYRDLLQRADVDAVIVATPNFTHREIVLAACAAKKHVLCEKPLALHVAGATEMYRAAQAAGVRHMTAFTYRFVPAMRYMKHLVDSGFVGTPYHFRAQRFQDWQTRNIGWRQVKKLAGTGEMGDMLSHRIDYAHHLVGPISQLVADLRTFIPQRGGQPSDVDDWVALLARFANSEATGVLESTKLATGRGEGHRGQDAVELNGSDGTIVYSTQKPLELSVGKSDDADLHRVDVPREFLVWPGSPRDPAQGDPLATFRYDQSFEFIDAIADNRPCRPSFKEGVMAQAVMDAALLSHAERRWVDVPPVSAS